MKVVNFLSDITLSTKIIEILNNLNLINTKNIEILNNLNLINTQFSCSGGIHFLSNNIGQGVKFEETLSNNQIIEQSDEFTFKFMRTGKYRIDFSFLVFIHKSNIVSDIQVKTIILSNPETDTDLDGTHVKKTIRKTIKTSYDTWFGDNSTDHAVDTISDVYYYTYEEDDPRYLKFIVHGPTTQDSYINSSSLTITYLQP